MEATFTMTAALVLGSTSCINITIFQDAVLEGDHSFTVLLTSVTPSGVAISSPFTSATVNIQDNEGTLP